MATCGSNTTWRCHKVVIPSGRLKKQTITVERPLMRGTNGNLCTRRRRRRAQTPGTPPFRALRPRRRGTTEASSTHTKPAANGGGGGQARPGRGRVLPPPRPPQEIDAKASLQAQVQGLREDNQRLQEESYNASAKLKKFTEWVFNTIDMN